MALTLEQVGVGLCAESVWEIHTVGEAYQRYLTDLNVVLAG